FLGDAHGILLDRLRLRGGHEEHGDLAAVLLLERAQALLQARSRRRVQRSGQIRHPRAERGDGDVRARGCEQREQQQCRGRAEPHRSSPTIVEAYLPKSTFGGVASSFSFSTVKVGRTWKPNSFAVRFIGNDRTSTL